MSDTFYTSNETLQSLLAIELAEQASWPREPVTAFRALTGDPRNEGSGAPAGLSGGGEGGSGGGEGGEGGSGGSGGGEGGGEGGAGGGSADIMAAFESFRDDVVGRFDGLESRIPEPAQEPVAPEQRTDFFDPRNFSDEDFDEDGELTREAQQRALNELVDQRVSEALSPVMQARAQERRDAEATALETTYPDLTNPEVFEPVLEQAQQMAAHLARSTGDRSWVEAWREPKFFETVYLASVGRKAAAGETPAGGQGGVTLESGGSAGPGGSGGDDGGKDIAKGIVSLAQKSKFRLGT